MTLAEKLNEIRKATGEKQKALAADFGKEIKGHSEESILRAGVMDAINGRTFIDIGASLPPAELVQKEAFKVEPCGRGYHLNFA